MSHNFFVLEINMLLCVLQVSISLRGPFLFWLITWLKEAELVIKDVDLKLVLNLAR